MSSVIMTGALSEFDVPSILQAVSLSRQFTLLRLWDAQKRQTGEIRLKAGQLLDATCGAKRGRAALHSLLRGKHHSFRVERFADPVNLPEPVAPLATLLLEMPHPVQEAPPPAPPPIRVAEDEVSQERGPEVTLLSNTVAEQLGALAELDRAVVCELPNCARCWEWGRGATPVSTDAICSLAATLAGAATFAAADFTTIELRHATLVIRPHSEAAIAVFAFGPSTPLGLVRMLVTQAEKALAGAR